jgi:hypothetical protein
MPLRHLQPASGAAGGSPRFQNPTPSLPRLDQLQCVIDTKKHTSFSNIYVTVVELWSLWTASNSLIPTAKPKDGLPCFDERVEEPKTLPRTYQGRIPPRKAYWALASTTLQRSAPAI